MKYVKRFEIKILFLTNRILCLRKAQGRELTKVVLLFVKNLLFYYSIATMEELDIKYLRQ